MSRLQDLTVPTGQFGSRKATGSQTVRATFAGALAVHPTIGAGPIGLNAWTVTHRATGRAVATMPKQRDALALARRLNAAFSWGPSLKPLTPTETRAAKAMIREARDRAWFSHCGI